MEPVFDKVRVNLETVRSSKEGSFTRKLAMDNLEISLMLAYPEMIRETRTIMMENLSKLEDLVRIEKLSNDFGI